MKLRVFLDTNVFIYAFEFPESNSYKIIELLNKGIIEAVISERVIKEVMTYFRKFYNKDMASSFRDYLLRTCTIVFHSEVKQDMGLYKEVIKNKDLEQLTVVKKYGIRFLISYDKDFEKCDEYFTPKSFIEYINYEPSTTEF